MSRNISLKDFINNKYSGYLDTITTLSYTGKKEFIVDDRKFFNFDKMICEFYNETYKPKSADALYVLDDNTILFIEFKTGYKNNISVSNISDNKYCSICQYNNIYPECHAKYCYLIACKKLAQQDKNKGIFLKIVESYLIFKEKFIPDYIDSYINSKNQYLCTENKQNKFFFKLFHIITTIFKKIMLKNYNLTNNVKYKFWLVIDSPADGILDSYKKKKNTKQKGNIFSDMKHSFQRFYDKDNKSYYDEILVLSEFEFKSKVNKLFR